MRHYSSTSLMAKQCRNSGGMRQGLYLQDHSAGNCCRNGAHHYAGSTQGIGLGMLRGLADAGADVVMHGLVMPEDAKAKTGEIASEFGVQCRHSAADVTKPAEIRCSSILIQDEAFTNFVDAMHTPGPMHSSSNGTGSFAATFGSRWCPHIHHFAVQ